ncbi:hypothetical protein IV57_GL002042 [Companilactobacillus kimchiensis]|uniref:Uncharacterized protein n=1 Tax=Companilactobacillus kimchiensis TaxID=993692 RepID=A0A0R2LJE5_9LACO|nr:hypothetical protein IV57_GL002042 [Companilactobacillus kimchiensis]
MKYFIALITLALGGGQIFVTIKALRNLKYRDKRIVPRFVYFALAYGSLFGLLLVFSGFDIIFKWI